MDDKLTPMQELLIEAKLAWIAKHKNPRISDNKFARILGVSAASFNHWVNGIRVPDYSNAVKLSQSPLIGKKIFQVLGYEEPILPYDSTPELVFVADNWNLLGEEVQTQIFDLVKEYLSGKRNGDH